MLQKLKYLKEYIKYIKYYSYMNEILYILSGKLSYDILYIIKNLIYSFYVNKIIKKYRNYILHKNFIIDFIYKLPVCKSLFPSIDLYDRHLFIVIYKYTYYYFKKLSNLINGNEIYLDEIESLYSRLSDSLEDYEWIGNVKNKNFLELKKICIYMKNKYNFNYFIE